MLSRDAPNKPPIWIVSLAIALASLLASAYFWHRLEAAHAKELSEAHARLEKRAEVSTVALEQYVEMVILGIDNTLRQLRSAYLANHGQFDNIAKETLQNLPPGMVQFVTIFGADGDLLYSSNDTAERINFKDREHFSAHVESSDDQLFISQPIVGRIAGVPLIQMTRPIRGKGGELIGVIGLPLRPDFVARQLDGLHIEKEDLLAIVRLDGSFVSRSRNLDEALKMKVPADRPYLLAKPGERGLFHSVSTVDKKQLAFSWARMERWPLAVAVAVDEQPQISALQRSHAGER